MHGSHLAGRRRIPHDCSHEHRQQAGRRIRHHHLVDPVGGRRGRRQGRLQARRDALRPGTARRSRPEHRRLARRARRRRSLPLRQPPAGVGAVRRARQRRRLGPSRRRPPRRDERAHRHRRLPRRDGHAGAPWRAGDRTRLDPLHPDQRRAHRRPVAASRAPRAVRAVQVAGGLEHPGADAVRRRPGRGPSRRRLAVPAPLGLRQRRRSSPARAAAPTGRAGPARRSASTRRGATRIRRRS